KAFKEAFTNHQTLLDAFVKVTGNGIAYGMAYGIGNGMPSQELEQYQEQEKEPPTPPGGGGGGELRSTEEDPGFLRFWPPYPRQEGRPAALAAWRKLAPAEATVKLILEALAPGRIPPGWRDEGGRYIPGPGKWLRERRGEAKPIGEAVPPRETPKQIA